jgi:hypothetical protein
MGIRVALLSVVITLSLVKHTLAVTQRTAGVARSMMSADLIRPHGHAPLPITIHSMLGTYAPKTPFFAVVMIHSRLIRLVKLRA